MACSNARIVFFLEMCVACGSYLLRETIDELISHRIHKIPEWIRFAIDAI